MNADDQELSAGVKIKKGFQINYMVVRNADSGKVIWQENKDFSSPDVEHKVRVPIKILHLRAVSREINFSTIEPMKNLRIDQKAFFKGYFVDEWSFEIGCFEADTTNSWQSPVLEAFDTQALPANVLSGKVTIQTNFYEKDTLFTKSVVRLYYV